jgi:cytochrome c oxidase subunit 2
MEEKGTAWLPEALSTLAPPIDNLFYFVTWISGILLVGVTAAIIYFVYKYRRRTAEEVPIPVKEHKALEVTWIVIPTILVLLTFNWGFKTFLQINVSPPDAYQIQVRARQWLWEFEYPNGTKTTNELHVPVDRPVRLNMSSEDVLHSLFIPVFRVKHDVLPDRYTSVWFEATQTGEYQVFCTEYCGTQHSGMLAKVVVETQEAFNEWLQSGGGAEDMPLPEYGALLYTQQVCNSCHTTDGSPSVGPTFQGLFGKTESLADGSTVQVDENYLRESIITPNAKVVAGFAPVMPAAYGSLNERQLSALIVFIKAQ